MAHDPSSAHHQSALEVDATDPPAPARRSFRVSFAAPRREDGKEVHVNHTASQQYDLSFISCGTHHSDHARELVTLRSPLYPQNVISFAGQRAPPLGGKNTSHTSSEPIEDDDMQRRNNRKTTTKLAYFDKTPGHDAASGALLIYPRKIDNLRRFRILFLGLLLSISSSTQGMHAVFGVLYLQQAYQFTPREMTIVYLSGVAVGMFTLPFGVLYDWFGPRIVVALGSIIASLGHMLFALTFAGHIPHTVSNCAVFYAVMCWGCYALNVAALPAVLTHMPRDRGQPTGLLQTFSGLGASVFACLFRGFFENNFENLMWFMFALTLAAGAGGTWFLEDAPYVVNRWQQRRITPRQQLRAYLIRNRYMSQLVPKRRYTIMTAVLVLLNLYLTIQAVCVSYLAVDMTAGKLRGIAIGAIVIVLMVLLLVVPLDSIDGLSEQDKQVIADAKAKEEALRDMQEERYLQRHLEARRAEAHDGRKQEQKSRSAYETSEVVGDEVSPSSPECVVAGKASSNAAAGLSTAPRRQQSRPPRPKPLCLDNEGDVEEEAQGISLPHAPVPVGPARGGAAVRECHPRGGVLSEAFGLPLYELTGPERSLVPVYMDDVGNDSEEAPHFTGASDKEKHCESQESNPGNPFVTVQVDADCESLPPPAFGSPSAGSEPEYLKLRRTAPSTHAHPRVETITLCGEVYVVPVYQTTFLESLTYLDLWLIFYTTLCVWGIGLVMTGNWNIQIMVKARYGAMEPKHYVLFSAMCGVSVAGGRVFLGVYERVLQLLRERAGTVVVPTLIYPIASVGLFVGVLLWIALPGSKALIMAYLVAAFFYGMSTSATFYVLGTIFDRDIGMHYGFCYLGAGVGFVLCYWRAWYLSYESEASPLTLGYCIGARRCMNRAVGVYLALAFSSIISSYVVHRRYSKLVRGELAQRRVIVPRIKQMLVACGCCKNSEGVKKKRSGCAAETLEGPENQLQAQA